MLIDIFRKRAGQKVAPAGQMKIANKKPKITQIRGFNSFPASCST
jgi:hypothetical protein